MSSDASVLELVVVKYTQSQLDVIAVYSLDLSYPFEYYYFIIQY